VSVYEYERDEDRGQRSTLRIVVGVAAVVALAGGAWFVAGGRSGGDDNADTVIPAESTDATEATKASDAVASDTTSPPDASAPKATTAPTVADSSPYAAAAPRTARTTTTTTRAPRPRATTSVPSTRQRPRPRPTSRSYETLADGSPVPALALFDVNQITLTGAVADGATKARLQALALANAKPGQGNIANFLTVNPDVPRNVGVRVVELTSARFPAGSAEVMPAHGQELDRVVSIMKALPHITALVIGHSDQRGDEQTNFELSASRAASVLDYLASQGVDPSRLSSRAVGEADLLTLNNDDAALALNRRTEFVFYGLLIE
jgi:outer membrane protein OmpA-like peptidoglycan-associated protein